MTNYSYKQAMLWNDIISPNKPEIYVLGSTQSGKTFVITKAIMEYAEKLWKYDPNKQYYGAIVGWTIETLKGNIVEVLEQSLKKFPRNKNKKSFNLIWNNDDKSLTIWNLKIFFFGFNNVKSFNKILGKPLILEWIDESARIYSNKELQQSFNEFPGRQMSFAGHPYLKTIHSFNVEGSDRHPYKMDYIDNKPNAIHYTFFPYDNPLLDTKEKIQQVVNMFPPGSLRQQKVFNKWVVAEGKVFTKLNVIKEIPSTYIMREIIIGIDYGNVNPTTFVPIALTYDQVQKRWKLVRLKIYYHDSRVEGDNPTTEYYSSQLRLFLVYLKSIYPQVPITKIVLDSEATHFSNRMIADNIEHELSKKGPGSVNAGVEYLQSLLYKEIFEILESPSIRYFIGSGFEESGKDEGLIEMDSYQYDKIKSEKEGTNCYKKELDHSIDATRYVLALMEEYGLAPVV
jgi:PBSX family phage terminase large subunit